MARMQAVHMYLLIALLVTSIAGCGVKDPGLDLDAYHAEIEDWRAGRLERLKGPTGYLNLVGLYWLSDGVSTFGSATDNNIVFPEPAAARVGALELTDAGMLMTVEDGVDVRAGDTPVTSILVDDDTSQSPVTITYGAFAWTIIKRDDRFAMRVRDYNHPAIASFPPIENYPVDPRYRVMATLNKFDRPKILNVDTVIEGLGWQPQSPGSVVFELGGETYELEAYDSGDQLFFVFGDQTSGRETYPAGRFLYADFPADGETTVLDFNRAYNPPCAFNDFATCPVASPQNRLATRIEAGEKFDPDVHSTPGAAH
jgi:uncharacterized protein (DUF1684 family)